MSKKKRVYVVVDEHQTILGVFSTYEKANDCIDKEIASLDDFAMTGCGNGIHPKEIKSFTREIVEYELDRFTFSPDHDGWFYEDNPGCVIKAVKEEWCEGGRIAYSPYGDRYVMTEDEE